MNRTSLFLALSFTFVVNNVEVNDFDTIKETSPVLSNITVESLGSGIAEVFKSCVRANFITLELSDLIEKFKTAENKGSVINEITNNCVQIKDNMQERDRIQFEIHEMLDRKLRAAVRSLDEGLPCKFGWGKINNPDDCHIPINYEAPNLTRAKVAFNI